VKRRPKGSKGNFCQKSPFRRGSVSNTAKTTKKILLYSEQQNTKKGKRLTPRGKAGEGKFAAEFQGEKGGGTTEGVNRTRRSETRLVSWTKNGERLGGQSSPRKTGWKEGGGLLSRKTKIEEAPKR